MKTWASAVGFLTLVAGVASAAGAVVAKSDRQEAKRILAGTLYLRIDAPCGTGRHPMGTYKFPLVEVSPDGVNTEEGEGLSAGAFHAQSTYWGMGPNDTVQLDEMEFDADTVEIEFEGIGRSEGTDTVLKFVGIHTLDDFRKAADRAFARVPLEDEHPEWPAETRKAIGERRLLPGMTKRQVFYITGSPVSVDKREEAGKTVEVWNMRQDRGTEVGYWVVISAGKPTGMPATLRFVDGLLENPQTGASSLTLDD